MGEVFLADDTSLHRKVALKFLPPVMQQDLGFALKTVAEAAPRETAGQPEEARPYPGLVAFTEEDTERFFGRDEEVAALWRKIQERSLLALIGPSGAGKTSFLRAGIMSHAPPGWRCLVATPELGHSPSSR